MYAGHVGLALGACLARRDLPLWLLVLVAQGCDWVEILLRPFVARPTAELWSHAYPWVVITASAVALTIGMRRRSVAAVLVVLLLYLSHPMGDFVTGYKVLWAGGDRVGLILFERPLADFAFQATIVTIGWLAYRWTLPSHRRRGVAGVLPLLLLLSLQAVADWVQAREHPQLIRMLSVGGTPSTAVVAD